MAAALMDRPSNKAVQNEARLISLGADPTAPTRLTDEQSCLIRSDPKIKRLASKSKALTAQIKSKGYRSIHEACGTRIYAEKKKADAALNRERTAYRDTLFRKARMRHFRHADTAEFNRQLGNCVTAELPGPTQPSTPPVYEVKERAEVVRLTCGPVIDMTPSEEHSRRLKCIRVWIKLQDRQESPRRGRCAYRPRAAHVVDVAESKTDQLIPVELKPTQCISCIGNTSKSYRERTFEYSTRNKMMSHVESEFIQHFAPDDLVPCPHHVCKVKGLVLRDVTAFKAHCGRYHKSFLRR
jgi:Protein of unknown function (DUF3435)